MKSCIFEEGSFCKVRGSNRKGKVVKKIINLDDVKWVKNSPHILIVEIGGDHFTAHPSQLKRIRQL